MGQTPKLLQPDGWAFLDWLTGIVQVNCESGRYHALKTTLRGCGPKGLSREQILLLETVTHESFHYFQICTSAFLHNIVKRLFADLAPAGWTKVGVPISCWHSQNSGTGRCDRTFDRGICGILHAKASPLGRLDSARIPRSFGGRAS